MDKKLIPKNGTMELHFTPSVPNIDRIASHTSSSCTLMLQCLIPIAAMLHIEKPLVVEGGTDVSKSPPLDSFATCLLPLLKQMGVQVTLEKVKKGYYPKGGGSITYSVKYNQLAPIELLKFAPPTQVQVTYYGKKNALPETHQDLKKDIKKMMREKFGQDLVLDYDFRVENTPGTKGDNYGIGCILRSETTIWDCSHVGEPATEEDVLKRLKHEIANQGCLDEHHQDQLLIYMALASGTSRVNIGKSRSEHTMSMLYVIEKFLPEAKIHFEDGILSIQGVNYLKS